MLVNLEQLVNLKDDLNDKIQGEENRILKIANGYVGHMTPTEQQLREVAEKIAYEDDMDVDFVERFLQSKIAFEMEV